MPSMAEIVGAVEEDGPPPDLVNHPPHYTQGGIECIDAIRAMMTLDEFVAHCRACAVKYSWRTGKKDDPVRELRKAAWYLNRAAEEIEKEGNRAVVNVVASIPTPKT